VTDTAVIDPHFVREQLVTPFSTRRKAQLVAEILVSYIRVRWVLARMNLRQTLLRLRAPEPVQPRAEQDRLREQLLGIRLGRAVERTLRLVPFDSRCLTRSLVLIEMLARRGTHADLVLGVTDARDFEAHAWVELGDVPLLPPIADHSRRLVKL
jgi:hypothetical protein